jgi:hypothetical protein
MNKALIIVTVILLVVCGGIYAAWKHVTKLDTSVTIEVAWPPGAEGDWEALEGRVLAFSSNANVPKTIGKSTGNRLTLIFGLPEYIKTHNKYSIGIKPSREGVNLASIKLTREHIYNVEFHTLDNGSFQNLKISPDGRTIAATNFFANNDQQIVLLDRLSGTIQTEFPPTRIYRWPSLTSDGNKILFHTFLGNNTYGDLFLGTRDGKEAEWKLLRLTDEPNTIYNWPQISGGGNYLVSNVIYQDKEETGVGLFKLNDVNIELVKWFPANWGYFPAITEDGSSISWMDVVDDDSVVKLAELKDDEWVVSEISASNFDLPDGTGINFAALSHDGRFITFIIINAYTIGNTTIGIYDLEEEIMYTVIGCDGVFTFPVLSNQTNE